MSQKKERTRVLRLDGKPINLVKKRGHLMVCAKGCCCGHVERGHAAVPVEFYKQEYKRRKLRNRLQLSMNGCLGPCPLSNVVLLFFDGRPIWFQSMNREPQIGALYDYIERLLEADGYVPPPPELAEYVFNYYTWSNAHDAGGRPAFGKCPVEARKANGILFLSHADTDLLTLHHARERLPDGFPPVRAFSLGKAASAEHMEALLAAEGPAARVIVARLLGSLASVPGLRRLVEACRSHGRQLVLVSGAGSPDPELTAASTVSPAVVHEVTAYLQLGGVANAAALLCFLADHFLLTGFGCPPPLELPRHGIYHPALPARATLADWRARHEPARPTVGILFYRAHWMSGNLGFIDALVGAIEASGANALPVFTSSLKESRVRDDRIPRNNLHVVAWTPTPLTPNPSHPETEGEGRPSVTEAENWPAAFDFFIQDGQPIVDVLVSTISFALGEERETHGAERASRNGECGTAPGAFAGLDVPVVQAICAGTARWQWEASPRGLNPLDTAMNIALPEFDGRIITVPISFKEPHCSQGTHVPRSEVADRSPLAAEHSAHCSQGTYVPRSEVADRSPLTTHHSPLTTHHSPLTTHHSPLTKDLVSYVSVDDRIDRVTGLALRLAALRRKARGEKRVAFILTNSPGKAARIGNAVGLDAPASLVHILEAMRDAGYHVDPVPADGDTLIHSIIDRCSYDETFMSADQLANAAGRVSLAEYERWFQELPELQRRQMEEQWGPPPGGAYVHDGHIALAGLELGNVFIALQPPRGYGMDPNAIYHRPDLPPPHNYYALYRWLRDVWKADAVVHLGKHGTLEWLPGKSVGLSADCYPDTFLGDLPLFYPFILNDPGEGAQAKRRGHAVIVDHLTPPLTSADAYDELAELMQLVDEYYQVELLDPSKVPLVQRQIWDLIEKAHLEEDLKYLMRQDHGGHTHEWDEGLTPEGTPLSLAQMQGREVAHLVAELDGYLCELAGAQIRDGLHVLGQVPEGEQLVGLLAALTRVPNLDVPSLRASVAALFGLDLNDLLAERGKRLNDLFNRAPTASASECAALVLDAGSVNDLSRLADRPLVTCADALETIDELCRHLHSLLQRCHFDAGAIDAILAETFAPHPPASSPAAAGEEESMPALAAGESMPALAAVRAVLSFVCARLVPDLWRTTAEIDNLLAGLDGRYVPAGPSGAPTRGMAHVLPTGRNFYAVDPRSLPSLAAWQVGQELAREVLDRYRAETGAYPETIGISVWGTSAMRTHGDDVAEILALLGVRPLWQKENRRIVGVEAIPLEELGRPRIDVTVRISGFFRDAFPHLIRILDEAVRLSATRDEPVERNFVRKHYLADLARLGGEDMSERNPSAAGANAERRARYRIFGSKPGSYGAGILPLIDERNWHDDADFAETYVNWGGYAYTAEEEGVDARAEFRHRLGAVQIALHNQDNREHDIFDSDDYFQFHGGMIASIRALTGRKPRHYFGDTHDPARPAVRDLKEEVLRVFRTRVVNPKWLESITRHGYKGGLELAATVDYLFGYDATANVVDDWMYEHVARSYALSSDMKEFFAKSNPWALHAIAERLLEAVERGLWAEPETETLQALRAMLEESATLLEARGEVVSPDTCHR